MEPSPARSSAAHLTLRLKKKTASAAVVTFARADGTTTSGRLGHGDFGAMHDLTHYVVESTLRLRLGFFGMVADGWNIPDFEIKHASRQWPDEALAAECIVGQLSDAIFGEHELDATDFNWMVTQAIAGVRPGAKFRAIRADELRAIKQRLDELLDRWRALPAGETLELEFSLD